MGEPVVNSLQTIFHGDAWLYQVAIIFAITLSAAVAKSLVMKVVVARTKKTKSLLDDGVADALHKPLAVLIWVLGAFFALEVIGGSLEFEAKIFEVLDPARAIVIVLITCWFLLRATRNVEVNYVAQKRAKEEEVDLATVDVAGKVARILIVIIGAMAGLQAIGFSVAGFLALGGVGGVAIGFAAKELISNFFGGLMIYLERPFNIGETITSSDRDIEGTVEEISWGQTKVRRFDSRPLYVPNSVFNTVAVQNNTRQTNRRIYEFVGVRYDDAAALPAIVADTRKMLQEHLGIDQDSLIMVSFDRFAASSLDFFIYCFTRTVNWADYHAVKQDVLFRIINIIDSHGAEIAFPTSTLHVPGAVRTAEYVEEDSEKPAVPIPQLDPTAYSDEGKAVKGRGEDD